jgi:hypothetical protein
MFECLVRPLRGFVRSALPVIAVFLLGAQVGAQVNLPQVPADPYRSFVGQWSGRIVVDHDHLPATVKITVTEGKDGRGMRWDYVFGKPGEKGYESVAKLIVLKPAEGRMLMHFKGSREQIYLTMGLDVVARDGVGQFSASACSTRGKCSICTFDLQPNSLSYLWKTTPDGKTFDVYSEFVLTRDPDPIQVNSTTAHQ